MCDTTNKIPIEYFSRDVQKNYTNALTAGKLQRGTRVRVIKTGETGTVQKFVHYRNRNPFYCSPYGYTAIMVKLDDATNLTPKMKTKFYAGNSLEIIQSAPQLPAKDIPLDEKCDTLQRFFYCIKADDIYVFVQDEHIIATDNDGNHWEDAEIYDFALNECLGWQKNGDLMDGFAAVSNEMAQRLKYQASAYGVTVKC